MTSLGGWAIAHARVDDVPQKGDGVGMEDGHEIHVGQEGLTDADALDGAKHTAYECMKSVAMAGHALKGQELVLRIWESTAGVIAKEVDSGRHIFVPGLGTFGSRPDVGRVFAPVEEFVQTHGLDVSFFTALVAEILPVRRPPTATSPKRALAPRPNDEMGSLAAQLDLLPRVKHSVASVARLLEVSSEVVLQALQAMVHRMGQQMATTGMVAVSFAPLGTFLCQNRCLSFHATLPQTGMEVTNFGPTIPLRKLLSTLERRKSKLGFRGPQPPKTSRPSGTRRPGPSGTNARDPRMAARMQRSMPAKPEVFPELLNAFSRTQAVPFSGLEDPGSPSERIASSFTGTASRLTWRPCQAPQRSLRWQPHFLEQPFLEARGGRDYSKNFTSTIEAGSPLDLELQEAEVTRAGFFETLFRYEYYLDTIPITYLAPFSDRWTQNIQRRTAVTIDGSRDEVPELMEQMWQEVLDDYRQAIRKVIIEHVLNEEKARKRTGISFVPSPMPLWGSQAFMGIEGTAGGLPEGWESITKRRMEMADVLVPCSRASVILLDLWHQKYDTLLLVDLPSGELMELQAFCAAQERKMKTVRSSLETWLGEVAEILKPCNPTSWPVTLLSTQVRGVVDRSIEAFLKFFGPERQMDAFLQVGLTGQGSEIELTTSLEEIEISLVQVFKNFVVSLSDLSLKVNSDFADASSVTLWSVTLEETYVQEAQASITQSILHNLERVEAALAPFDEFKYLLVEDARIKKLSEDNLTQDCVMKELKTLRAVQQNIRSSCAEEICLHMVSIQCSHINETLRSKAEEAIHILLESILRHLLLRNDHLCKSFEMVVNQVVKKPTSEMELVDLEMYIEEFRTTGLNELLKEFDSIREWLSFLFTCENQLMLALLKEKHFQAIYDSAHWVSSIQERVFDATNLKREREALESKFKEQRNKFLEDLEGYNEQVDEMSECGNLRQVDEYLERIQVLKNNFTRAHVEAEKLNAKEKRFGWEVRSPFEQLKRGEHALEPHFALWTLAYNMEGGMRIWLKGPMFHLDPAKVDFEVRGMRREALRLREIFIEGGGVVYPVEERLRSLDLFPVDALCDTPDEKIPAPAMVAAQLNNQAGQMLDTHLKILYSLCNKCLQTRHWEQISGVIGFPLEPDASFTLAKAIEMDIGQYMDDLQEISDAASAEYQVELAADAMEEEWKYLSFAFESWKQTGVSVFTEDSLNKIRQTLEDQLQRCSAFNGLEAAEAWEERLEEWQEWLQSMSDIASQCAKLQQLWIGFEVMFSGRDIYKQLPVDIQTFRKVDKFWRNFMTTVQSHPLARDVCKMPQVLETLSENSQLLQAIHDRLNDAA